MPPGPSDSVKCYQCSSLEGGQCDGHYPGEQVCLGSFGGTFVDFLEYLEIGIDLQILWMFSLNRWIVLQMMAVSSLMVSGKRPFKFG